MATKKPSSTKNGKATVEKHEKVQHEPTRIAIAKAGINDSIQFAKFMSAIMTDVACGCMTPEEANASCNAGGKMLKVVEMQMKYGGAAMKLQLTGPK